MKTTLPTLLLTLAVAGLTGCDIVMTADDAADIVRYSETGCVTCYEETVVTEEYIEEVYVDEASYADDDYGYDEYGYDDYDGYEDDPYGGYDDYEGDYADEDDWSDEELLAEMTAP